MELHIFETLSSTKFCFLLYLLIDVDKDESYLNLERTNHNNISARIVHVPSFPNKPHDVT